MLLSYQRRLKMPLFTGFVARSARLTVVSRGLAEFAKRADRANCMCNLLENATERTTAAKVVFFSQY